MFGSLLTISLSILTVFYAVLLLYLRIKLKGHSLPQKTGHPSVSVIIPAHNEASRLPGLFKSLSGQIYNEELTEFILINDRSIDDTGVLLKEYCSNHPNARYIEIDQSSTHPAPKKHALQQGIDAASNEIILTTDADCVHSPSWIADMAGCFQEDVSMVLGYAPYTTSGEFKSMFHRMLAFDYMAMGTISMASVAAGYPITSFGGNLAYRKRDFEEVGGFGESTKFISGDDDLLVHKFAEQAVGRLVFNSNPDSYAMNPPPRTFRDFIRQRLRFSSKHLAYPKILILVMSLIYMFNLVLLTAILYSFVNSDISIQALAALILKGALDLLLLKKGKDMLQERPLLHLYPLAAVPHLFYVIFIPLFAQIRSQRW